MSGICLHSLVNGSFLIPMRGFARYFFLFRPRGILFVSKFRFLAVSWQFVWHSLLFSNLDVICFLLLMLLQSRSILAAGSVRLRPGYSGQVHFAFDGFLLCPFVVTIFVFVTRNE